jgi:hypothetical protein
VELLKTSAMQSLAALALALALFSMFWVVLRLLRRRLSTISGHEIEFAALLVAIVSIVLTGIYVPNRIDYNNRAQQADSLCFESVLSTRKALDTVELGYQIGPRQRDLRLNDWQVLDTELRNTNFGCKGARLGSPGDRTALGELQRDFREALAESERRNPDTAYLERVRRWTEDAMESLQSGKSN